jgi:hypothetical protein
MKSTSLTTFNLYQHGDTTKRQVAIDPKKVVAVRETVHGSVIINYPGQQFFEVSNSMKSVVNMVNQGRKI